MMRAWLIRLPALAGKTGLPRSFDHHAEPRSLMAFRGSAKGLRGIAAAGCLLLLLAATRWPLAPKHLYFFDSANFALALENFDPVLHQPQPPGYPLFVGLTRLIHIWVADPQQVFLIAGLLAAWLAVLLSAALGARMFGWKAGVLAAALLFANPPFWLGGITNQIRVFLAVGSLCTALFAWRAIEKNASPVWFYATFGWLGVAAGFRPVESIFLLPLLLWVWRRSGYSPRRLAVGILILCATVAPWAAVTVAAMGGRHRVVEVLWGYANEQFHGSSRLFGAGGPAASQMLAEAVVWNFLGAAAWIWALPLRAVRQAYAGWGIHTRFLLVWFLPPFLFSAFVHIGDPDQALTTIPALCLFGGAVLSCLVEGHRRRRVWAMSAAAVVAGSLLFFLPPRWKLARAASYRAVAPIGRITDAAISAIDEVSKDDRSVIIDYGFPVSYRQIAYYFPDDYVVFLPGMPSSPASAGDASVFLHHKSSARSDGNNIVLPPGGKVLFLLPQGVTPRELAPELPLTSRKGRVFYTTSLPQQQFRFGAYRLTVDRNANSSN
jgi:hypothetical protein